MTKTKEFFLGQFVYAQLWRWVSVTRKELGVTQFVLCRFIHVSAIHQLKALVCQGEAFFSNVRPILYPVYIYTPTNYIQHTFHIIIISWYQGSLYLSLSLKGNLTTRERLKLEMEVDLWASRVQSAKHLSALQAARFNHHSGLLLHITTFHHTHPYFLQFL